MIAPLLTGNDLHHSIKKFRSYYTIREGVAHVKIFFLEMTPLERKTCGESEFDIFEAKKRFPDSGKAYCVLNQKSHFCDFSLQYTIHLP
jgi:hypothetical protein